MAGESGETVDLGDVLIVGDGVKTSVGKPVVEGAKVSATLVEQTRSDKITVFKRKRRKGYRRTLGHRQSLTVLRISAISAPGMKAQAVAAKAKPARKTTSKKAADKKAEPAAPAKAKAGREDHCQESRRQEG